MPPLITQEEALGLGRITDRAGIEELVERAWRARLERFGDSTDMCSLVNAKSGGCAEDCGFCAQSRVAEADTPMHAMMSPEQRVEMAFQLAEIDPTSVPINLLNPRPRHQVRGPELMDPWDAIEWIAIFRLIMPRAHFRLCGGRNENLGAGELQQLAVRAGLNGVMMGNFLTTLGSEPEQDRAIFEGLGLNVARQADNGSNPRPDNRSGWLEGETPVTPGDHLIDRQAEANFWDPASQLRYRKKRKGA